MNATGEQPGATDAGAASVQRRAVVAIGGNGPQVGFILLRSELVHGGPFVPALSLDMAGTDSEGGVGYIVANALARPMALQRPS